MNNIQTLDLLRLLKKNRRYYGGYRFISPTRKTMNKSIKLVKELAKSEFSDSPLLVFPDEYGNIVLNFGEGFVSVNDNGFFVELKKYHISGAVNISRTRRVRTVREFKKLLKKIKFPKKGSYYTRSGGH